MITCLSFNFSNVLPPVSRVLMGLGLFAAIAPLARAVDFTNGLTTAVPVKDGKPPVIDGDLGDWDLSAQEPTYIAAQTIRKMNAQWAVMYDDTALYFSAEVAMPDRAIKNPYNPQDAFWKGDIVQVRLAADPALAGPLERQRDKENNRVSQISFWLNSLSGKSFLQITHGTLLNLGKEVLPAGSEVVIKEDKAHCKYVMESRIPWSALNVPGGLNPFKPGERAAFLIETLWVGGDPTRVATGYRVNPGNFGFRSPEKWGQLEFAAKSPGARVRPTMAQLIHDAGVEQTKGAVSAGVPIGIDVPGDGLKVSVNIVDEKGAVIRELIGGEPHPKGPLEVRWDGRDELGNPLKPGRYTWSAYFHKGLKAEYQGGVGSSGHPFYNTADDHGAWGGDHSNPIDVAADADSLYLLWPMGESGRPLVKTTLEGRVLWRVNPFVSGGFGPFYALAVDNGIIYLARGPNHLARVDAKTGALLTWGEGGPSELDIFEPVPVLVPADTTPFGLDPPKGAAPYPAGMTRPIEPSGIAAGGGKVYMSSYSLNQIFVVDAVTGSRLAVLDCPGARGLSLSKERDLFAVSCVHGGRSEIVKFSGGAGPARPVVTSGLDAPYDVAVDQGGRIAVTDLGASNQVKVFDGSGKLLRVLGVKGGRPWQGPYDAKGMAFLKPAGLAVDSSGAIVVSESSLPKVFSRINLADGTLLDRWFGPGVYWNSTWPMPDEPRHLFYMLKKGVGRAWLGTPDSPGVPDAYWNPSKEYTQVDDMDERFPQPDVVRATNGELYFVKDSGDRAILLLHDDVMRPLATWNVIRGQDPANARKRPYTEVWIDRNGDGHVQDDEKNRFTALADGSPLPVLRASVGGMHMEPDGDLYIPTSGNSILRIPAEGFGPNGLINWNLSKAAVVVPEVVPGRTNLPQAGRAGFTGVHIDHEGNLYTAINAVFNGGNPTYDFPDPEVAKRMMEGLGHTARFNVVQFAKFDAKGNRLWIAGRKATSGARPGEMYHFWNLAGLVNDRYIVGASEWGQITFYTADGFYVDAIMDNPGEVRQPGPYAFGGETAGGRVEYFPKTDEVWAYSLGMAYKVAGFSHGLVEGESRARGVVELDKVYGLAGDAAAESVAGPLVIVPLHGKPLDDATAWRDVPVSTLRMNHQPLARAQLGQDKEFLYARIAVKDGSPLQNTADQLQLAFKQGDTAGIVLGPVRKDAKPGPGDVRFMAVQLHGQAKLVAMKAVTRGGKKPFEYSTPAGGTSAFEFVGEVAGGGVRLERTDDGYIATMAIPRSFLEFDLKSALRGDLEVRLSGAGGRGIQTVSRNYLFTPATTETSMTDDVPTESRLYPQYWGAVEVK